MGFTMPSRLQYFESYVLSHELRSSANAQDTRKKVVIVNVERPSSWCEVGLFKVRVWLKLGGAGSLGVMKIFDVGDAIDA